jgi:hypothetical protein
MIKRLLKYVGILLVVAIASVALLLAYAYLVEPSRLVVIETKVEVSNWDRSLSGLKVIALADVHGGSNGADEAKLRSVVETVNQHDPDIVVLLGDYISELGEQNEPRGKRTKIRMPVDTIFSILGEMRPKHGIYAVIGNHDWWHNESEVASAMTRAGIIVLENKASQIDINGSKLSIVGIEDYWKRYKVEIDEALSSVSPRRNILAIAHNPDSFDQTPVEVSLLLAGHTHGGQVYIPFWGAPLPVAKREYTRGLVRKGDSTLFVTSGIGTSGPPIRFGVPPEIVVLTIVAKE